VHHGQVTASAGPCPGGCNRQYREAREAFDQALALYDPLDSDQSRPIPPDITPWPGDPVWCGRDSARIVRELAELDEVASLLAASADGFGGASGEQRVSGSPVHPSPSPAGDDLDELVSMLCGWEDAYRDAMGWPAPPRRGALASRLTACVSWLGVHSAGILAHRDIAEPFGAEVLLWHRELAAKAKAGARRLRKPLRCPGCSLLTLIWDEGEADVHCANPGCSRVMSYSDYEAHVEMAAGKRAVA